MCFYLAFNISQFHTNFVRNYKQCLTNFYGLFWHSRICRFHISKLASNAFSIDFRDQWQILQRFSSLEKLIACGFVLWTCSLFIFYLRCYAIYYLSSSHLDLMFFGSYSTLMGIYNFSIIFAYLLFSLLVDWLLRFFSVDLLVYYFVWWFC